MKQRSPLRMLHMFSAAVIDQIMLSGANFVIGFLLIRKTSDVDYGIFVLVQSTVLLLTLIQASWLSTPLGILAPKRSPEIRREMMGAIEEVQRRWLLRLMIVAMCVPALGFAVGVWDGFKASVIAVAILASWTALLREFRRRVLLVYGRAPTVLGIDAVYSLIFLGGTALAAFLLNHAVIWAILAMFVAGWVGARGAHSAFGRDPGWVHGDAKVYFKEMRRLGLWIAVGALAYWLFSQSYNYVLVSRLDLKAVADVNASRLLIMPTIVFTLGLENVLVPKAAGWLVHIGIGALLKRLLAVFLAIAALDLCYFLFVWTFRDWLTHDLLHKSISDRDRLLALWACIALIGTLRIVFQSALVAMEPLKIMAGITSVSAVASLILMWFGISWWGSAGVLIGQIGGDTTLIFGYAILMRREWLRFTRRERANAV